MAPLGSGGEAAARSGKIYRSRFGCPSRPFTPTGLQAEASRPAGLPGSPAGAVTLRVGLLQLRLGPLGRVLGLHALDGLGVHVDQDVLDERLRRLPAGWTGIPGPTTELGRLPEGDELGIAIPHGVLLPIGGRAIDVAVVRYEVRLELRTVHQPAKELLGHLLVLGVLHDGVILTADRVEAPRRPPRHVAVIGDLGDVRELALGHEVD